jgi:integrase
MTLTKLRGVWKASFLTADGQRKVVTTRCTDKEQARKVVAESGLQDLELAAKAGRLTQQAIGHITIGRKLTMDAALKEFEERFARIRAPKTVVNVMISLHTWVNERKLGKLPPSAITEKHIDSWVNNPESETGLQTRRLNLAAIRTFFDHCIDQGWVVGNPAGRSRITVNMGLLSHEQKEHAARIPFTRQEVRDIVNYCKKKDEIFWQFATLCSSQTGLRLSDICQLEWKCFDKSGVVVVWADKTNKRQEIPITQELAELAGEIPVADAKYLFPAERLTVTDPAHRSLLSVQFGRICDKVGIKGKSFHCLRHTAASDKFSGSNKEALARKLADTLTLKEISTLLGHASSKTTKGYVH